MPHQNKDSNMYSADQIIANNATDLPTKNVKTKMVLLAVSAITRVEYSTMIEVPVDTNDEQLLEIGNAIFDATDEDSFVKDNEYWERGSVIWSEQDE